MRGGAALPGRAGRRPDRHQRRAGADRRRPDRRGRGRLRRAARWCSTSALEERIAEILRAAAARAGRDLDPEAVRAANRKQAVVPDGRRRCSSRSGTAPGLVVPPATGDGPTVVVLPGPPRELQPMWRDGGRRPTPFRARDRGRGRATASEMLRLFGIPESEIADDAARGRGRRHRRSSGLEITTCLRRGEIEIVDALRARRPRRPTTRFDATRRASATPTRCSPTDGSTVDEQVADAAARARRARSRRPSRAPAGCWPARLTERAGSSAYVLGGAGRLLQRGQGRRWPGVDPALIERVRRGLAGGRRGAGRRRARALRRRRRRRASPASPGPGGGTPRRSRSGSSASAVAGRDGARLTRALQPARRPRRRPRPLDDRRDAPAAAAAARRARRRGATRPTGCALSAVRARLFVALELPEVRDALAAFGRAAAARRPRAARRRAADALHVTLAFLGHRALDEVDPRARGRARAWPARRRRRWRSATRCGCRRAGRTCSRSGWTTPTACSPRCRPRVVGRAGATALPWEPERGRSAPHVTVARVRRGARAADATTLPEAPQATFAGRRGDALSARTWAGADRRATSRSSARAAGLVARTARVRRELRRDRA